MMVLKTNSVFALEAKASKHLLPPLPLFNHHPHIPTLKHFRQVNDFNLSAGTEPVWLNSSMQHVHCLHMWLPPLPVNFWISEDTRG